MTNNRSTNMLHIGPAQAAQSFPSIESTLGEARTYLASVQHLRTRLEDTCQRLGMNVAKEKYPETPEPSGLPHELRTQIDRIGDNLRECNSLVDRIECALFFQRPTLSGGAGTVSVGTSIGAGAIGSNPCGPGAFQNQYR